MVINCTVPTCYFVRMFFLLLLLFSLLLQSLHFLSKRMINCIRQLLTLS